ncbi:hypothetical protein BKA70DRAFT_1422889 [Coprinopsis sp. MPI-PUGE-AT-0042]|nr:hypothetical protein BKA70DRAFT_1422889 [Coprinopsis sp. MPI-PUGE-AT-0042]
MSSRIDDRDDRVEFTGSWVQVPLNPASGGTISQSSRTGDRVTTQFVGTSIEIWGSSVSFRTSDQAPTTMVLNLTMDNQFIESVSSQVLSEDRIEIRQLWKSSQLPSGGHSLEVAIHELEDAIAVIDYFQVFTPGGTPDPSSSSRTEQLVTTISPPQTSETSSGTASAAARSTSPAPTSSVALSNANKTPIGPIVGGVIGGILIILFGVLAAMWIMKGRRRTNQQSGTALITPFEKNTNHPVTSASNPLTATPQPKRHPRAPTNQNHTSPISKSHLSSNRLPPTIEESSSSAQSNPSSSGPQVPEENPQVAEAIRTLQTYLQQQPQGLRQVVQGLGVSTADTSNPPPAYDERR